MSGFVYVVRSGKFFKIGFTNQSIEKRISTLQTGSPSPKILVLHFEAENPSILEKELHGKFKNKRIDGEWFALADSDIDELSDMKGSIINQDSKEDGVMIFKSGMEEIIRLEKTDPSASHLFMFIVSNMDEDNCMMCSGTSIAKLTNCTLRIVRTKIRLLNDLGFITILKIGNNNVYCVNANVAWNNHPTMLSGAKFVAPIKKIHPFAQP